MPRGLDSYKKSAVVGLAVEKSIYRNNVEYRCTLHPAFDSILIGYKVTPHVTKSNFVRFPRIERTVGVV